MPSINRTTDFRKVLAEKRSALPETKRRRMSRPSKSDTEREGQNVLGKEYISEAYVILNHINTLTRMLATIRKPYLNLDSRNPPLSRQISSRNIDLAGPDQSWSEIRSLTNEERDQVDLQARVILSRCADRVKEMEILEKRRVELEASKTNPLARLLPARLRQDASTATSDFIAAHHSSITWYLSRRLAEASQTQKEMQEERVKRQIERTKTLGSGVAREAAILGAGEPFLQEEQSVRGGSGGWLASSLAATIGAPSPSESSQSSPFVRVGEVQLPPDDFDDDDDEIELSQSQIMQFETENANILRAVQDTLESVQQAESRLMDISALQMELVTHLTRQTELTDQLYEDAIATTSTVEKGNIQLREAKRRAKDSRMFILLFLIGASLSLLFLHYY
ncbi:hypothetical protein PILCRDRAFT_811152 [Piloderma croceum F 1598]|uniref:t-SNARE coiled-coil homology domain-containing protein n=1 Tax=Piloderma croceum (strain F 1598) TaxID=765440 RepID=A0A0C3GJ60_PILCF|nr:hypothetical protein PILCRDRAFT_811152 [Piloderma croceum F 1598]